MIKTLLVSLLVFCLLIGCQNNSDESSTSLQADSNETFWTLADDSELRVRLSPWPLQATDNTKFEIEATTGDWDETLALVNQVMVAVTQSASQIPSSGTPLRFVRTDAEGSKYFEGEVKLSSGKNYLRPSVKGIDRETDFEPWELVVK